MLSIRQYKKSDQEAVITLHVMALKDTNAYITKTDYYQDLENVEEAYLNQGGEFLVGFLKDKLVAMGALKKISQHRAELKRMRVHPDFQRMGLGQSMLNELEKRAKKFGYKEIQLFTSVNQVAAQNFYLRNEYNEIRREKKDRPLEVIFYEKTL